MIPKGRSRFSDQALRHAEMPSPDRQRIDKWLWHARTVRTRSDAGALVAAGHVRLNGARVIAASHAVRIGDVVTIALDRSVRVVRVEGFSDRRGDATAARALFSILPLDAGT